MDLSKLKIDTSNLQKLVIVGDHGTNIEYVKNNFPNVKSVDLSDETDEEDSDEDFDSDQDEDSEGDEECEDEIPEWLTENLANTFIAYSNSIVPTTIKEAAATCTKAEHYACLMKVCYDYNCLTDISAITAFAQAMVGMGCVKRRVIKNMKSKDNGKLQTWKQAVATLSNSLLKTTNKFPISGFKSWPESSELKKLKAKCSQLGTIFESRNIHYQPKK